MLLQQQQQKQKPSPHREIPLSLNTSNTSSGSKEPSSPHASLVGSPKHTSPSNMMIASAPNFKNVNEQARLQSSRTSVASKIPWDLPAIKRVVRIQSAPLPEKTTETKGLRNKITKPRPPQQVVKPTITPKITSNEFDERPLPKPSFSRKQYVEDDGQEEEIVDDPNLWGDVDCEEEEKPQVVKEEIAQETEKQIVRKPRPPRKIQPRTSTVTPVHTPVLPQKTNSSLPRQRKPTTTVSMGKKDNLNIKAQLDISQTLYETLYFEGEGGGDGDDRSNYSSACSTPNTSGRKLNTYNLIRKDLVSALKESPRGHISPRSSSKSLPVRQASHPTLLESTQPQNQSKPSTNNKSRVGNLEGSFKSTSGEEEEDNFEPLANPLETMAVSMNNIIRLTCHKIAYEEVASADWEQQLSGVVLFTRLAIHHTSLLEDKM